MSRDTKRFLFFACVVSGRVLGQIADGGGTVAKIIVAILIGPIVIGMFYFAISLLISIVREKEGRDD